MTGSSVYCYARVRQLVHVVRAVATGSLVIASAQCVSGDLCLFCSLRDIRCVCPVRSPFTYTMSESATWSNGAPLRHLLGTRTLCLTRIFLRTFFSITNTSSESDDDVKALAPPTVLQTAQPQSSSSTSVCLFQTPIDLTVISTHQLVHE